MLKMIADLADVLQQPGGLAAITSAKPRSLTSFRIASQLRNAESSFATVIDGGANVGQFARAVHSVFPQARILSFEPLPDVAQALRLNLADANHQVYELALGNSDGIVEFHRPPDSQTSSALRILNSDQGLLDAQNVQSVTVAMAKLDTVLQDIELALPVLLKLDLQGYELEALKGAQQTLGKCSHVLLEAVFEPSYQGEPLFDDVSTFLRNQGFRFRGVLNFLRNRQGQIAQIDALFENNSCGYVTT